MTKTILTSKGVAILVDDDDYDRCKAMGAWFLRKGYAANVRFTDCVRQTTLMHRLIMDAQPGQIVDHINRVKTDNRKSNLRFCSQANNIRNQGPRGTSGFKGVYPQGKRWRVVIRLDGRSIYCGSYDCKREAACAYDTLAVRHFGEFAVLNLPDELHDPETPAARALGHSCPVAPDPAGGRTRRAP